MASSKAAILCILVVILCMSTLTNAVYFYLSDSERSCFLQEVPEDTAVVAKYANIDSDHHGVGFNNRPVTVTISVTDPSRQLIVNHEATKKGSVAWTAAREGEYTICVEMVNSQRKGRTYKFGLTFAHAEQTIDYGALAKQEHLSAIVVEMRKMTDRVGARSQEQQYQKSLEEKFRDETEDMNAKVMWWSMLQTIVIIGSVIWQIVKLRSFFRARKLQ